MAGEATPSIAPPLSPWWGVGGLGIQGLGAGIGAYMQYLSIEEQKKARRQAQRNFEDEMKFKKSAYNDAAPQRATDLTRSNYSAAEQAQNWRDRLAAMRIW